jgi:type II secretory pathway pseudopilin PulG
MKLMSGSPSRRNKIVRQMRGKRQGGFVLLELALALAISTILLTSQFSQITRAIDEGNATATGEYMVELQDAVNRYVQTNVIALKNGTTVSGFNTALKPTVAELLTAGILPVGFSTTSPLQLSFVNTLTRSAICSTTPSDPNCVITGITYSTGGYKDLSGQIRSDILSVAVAKIGVDGSMSMQETPNLLTSMGGATQPNPAGSAAGVLAIRTGSGSGLLALLSQYYKLDGSSALTGAMNANNNDVTGVKNLIGNGNTQTTNLTVLGDTTLSGAGGTPGTACSVDQSVRRNSNGTGLVLCSAGAWQLVGNVVTGIADGGACSSAGMVGSNSTGVSFVCNGSYWSTLNVTANPGDACAPAGRMATSIGTREQLVCKNGAYVKLVNLIAKSIEVSRQLVSDGTTVNKPACDVGGTAAYSFQMSQTVVDVSVTPPRQAMYIAATDNGPSWTVAVKLKDSTGAVFSANAYSITAVMKLECSY